jgi:hypothetical protein
VNVYVYEGYLQAGGTYMAYHLGRILKQYFGCRVTVVGSRPDTLWFSYPEDFPVIGLAEFEASVSSRDLLICNPSFSPMRFGLRLPCRKLCYVQGIRTPVLDVYFDHYVAASRFVGDFLRKYYSISCTIIPPFINIGLFDRGKEWESRSDAILVSSYKNDYLLLDRLRRVYENDHPDMPLTITEVQPGSQEQIAETVRSHKYYLSLAVMEGFGLLMLEAMAAGCAVAGWDSGGGSEYTVDGVNCLLSRYGDVAGLSGNIYRMFRDSAFAKQLSQAGPETARRFSIERFDKAWVEELKTRVD